MLKTIDPLISPELLYILAKMGHGDVIALVDNNYPAYSSGVPVIHIGNVDTTKAAQVLGSLLPLDRFVAAPIRYMEGKAGEKRRPVTEALLEAFSATEERAIEGAPIGRLQFYDEAQKCHAIVVCNETRPYGCYLIQKGVWPELMPE